MVDTFLQGSLSICLPVINLCSPSHNNKLVVLGFDSICSLSCGSQRPPRNRHTPSVPPAFIIRRWCYHSPPSVCQRVVSCALSRGHKLLCHGWELRWGADALCHRNVTPKRTATVDPTGAAEACMTVRSQPSQQTLPQSNGVLALCQSAMTASLHVAPAVMYHMYHICHFGLKY